MKRRTESACPVRSVLNSVGSKWSILIIDILGNTESMRFNEINKTLGDISQKMLTSTLRSLEADGILSRKMYNEIPPRVEYALTQLGQELLPHIRNLIGWSQQNLESINQEFTSSIGYIERNANPKIILMNLSLFLKRSLIKLEPVA